MPVVAGVCKVPGIVVTGISVVLAKVDWPRVIVVVEVVTMVVDVIAEVIVPSSWA